MKVNVTIVWTIVTPGSGEGYNKSIQTGWGNLFQSDHLENLGGERTEI
jgi:hypothetical protein